MKRPEILKHLSVPLILCHSGIVLCYLNNDAAIGELKGSNIVDESPLGNTGSYRTPKRLCALVFGFLQTGLPNRQNVTSCAGCHAGYHEPMARDRIALCISLPSDLAAELDTACAKEGRNRSEFIRRVLRSYLNDRLWQLAESLNIPNDETGKI